MVEMLATALEFDTGQHTQRAAALILYVVRLACRVEAYLAFALSEVRMAPDANFMHPSIRSSIHGNSLSKLIHLRETTKLASTRTFVDQKS